MLVAICAKKNQRINDGKAAGYCNRILCEHLRLNVKKQVFKERREKKWRSTFSRSW